MNNAKELPGIRILAMAGIIVGIFSVVLGVIGEGALSIILGGLWIFFSFRLIRFQISIRKPILIISFLFLALYFLGLFAAMAIDKFFYVAIVMKTPLAVLSFAAILYLMHPRVKRYFV